MRESVKTGKCACAPKLRRTKTQTLKNTSDVMFPEQAWCCGLRGAKKAKTIPGKLGEGEGQSGHSESILKFECKGQRWSTHSPCSESLHCEVTGLNHTGHFAS